VAAYRWTQVWPTTRDAVIGPSSQGVAARETRRLVSLDQVTPKTSKG
jgi:hypothetical protein